MIPFPIGNLEIGAEHHEGSYSEVWRGTLLLHSSNAPIPVYFKMLPPREFWVETACLSFATAAGLPVGACYWGHITRNNLTSSKAWEPNEQHRFVVATRVIRGTEMCNMESEQIVRALKKHPALMKICVIDELFANGDRHTNNVMIDSRGNPTFIDFGHAFGGPDNPWTNVIPRFDNVMLSELISGMDRRQRSALGVELSEAVNEIKDAMPSLNEALAKCPWRTEMMNFVQTRLTLLRELLALRLEVGQQQPLYLPTRPEIQR